MSIIESNLKHKHQPIEISFTTQNRRNAFFLAHTSKCVPFIRRTVRKHKGYKAKAPKTNEGKPKQLS